MIPEVDVLIIGAGVVGLAIAERLSGCFTDIVLVDMESSFGQHASGRNSEVIHSGIYYNPGSLKSSLCVNGNLMMYKYLEKNNIEHINCGKFVVATTPEEIPLVEQLHETAKINEVEGTRLVTSGAIRKEMPEIRALMGLFVPSTGIMDTHTLMKRLEYSAVSRGCIVSYNTEVTGIEKSLSSYRITFSDDFQINAGLVINSAGLFSDKVAEMAGFDADSSGWKINYCKGLYFRTARYSNFRRIIYPVPAPEVNHLGIHTRLHLDGSIAFGPDSFYVDEIDYSFPDGHREDFVSSIGKYLDISGNDLTEDDCGIRPKLQKKGGKFRDFVIRNEKESGYSGFINLIGIESPGLTSSLAIAEYVENLM